ncbi:MAG: carboxylating nicotinate-nucleotide diphosphorylase [Pseudomonadota bacterium]
MNMLLSPAVEQLIDLALEEDLGRGDVTSATVLLADSVKNVEGIILAKQQLVVFGLAVASRVFGRVDTAIRLTSLAADGELVKKGTAVARVNGPVGSILAAERTALNFLMRLSGVATLAHHYAEAVAGSRTKVVDTRKTTPGWRSLEKAAVKAGGCGNHRSDLGSGILIKDNHIAACGGVGLAVQRARANAPHPLRIEVEVTSLAELDEALRAGAELVLLDNLAPADVEPAVARAHQRGALVEVSGGVTLERIETLARQNVDYVSVGALTHSAPAVDMSLELERN